MGKKMPVGTIRHWEQGDVIKAYENSVFGAGWIPLKTSPEFDELGREMDRTAANILSKRIPLKGELVLDHEIDSFESDHDPDDESAIPNGPFKSSEFKKYEGFEGSGRYAFRNEFSRRFMDNPIKLADEINEALLEANERAKRDQGLITAGNAIFLTKEEVQKIKDQVRKEFKEDNNPFTLEDAEKLAKIVRRTKEQMDAGLNFEGTQKEIYDECIKLADSISENYERLGVKKKLRKEIVEKIKEAFPDNWAVRQSFKEYADNKYSDYLRKYRKQIFEDEAADQEATFGVKLDESNETFYKKLYKKLKGADTEEYPFSELVELRFAVKYGKELRGDWSAKMLPCVENIEKLIHDLPAGHFLNNFWLKAVTQIDYGKGENGGYAWFSAGSAQINLSKELMRTSLSPWSRGNVSEDNEFDLVMRHEIGHAVSKKFGQNENMLYKEFAKACGWSWSQDLLKRGEFSRTDGAEDTPREGSNSHIQLMTNYSNKSPEEAFAECYAIYGAYQKEIDNFLDTKEISQLNKISKTFCDKHFDDSLVRENIPNFDEVAKRSVEKNNEILKTIKDSNQLQRNNIKTELISPWDCELHESTPRYVAEKVKRIKSYEVQQMPPVIGITDNGKVELLEGANRQMHAKMEKKMMPCITISRELYSNLSSKGYSNTEICDFLTVNQSNEDYPTQDSIPIRKQGLSYRQDIITTDVIKQNKDVLECMRRIFHSDELKKAITELFGISIDNEDEIQKAHKYNHKYKSKKPDGKGGWIYEYEEEKNEDKKDSEFKYSLNIHGINFLTNVEQTYGSEKLSPYESKGSFKATITKNNITAIAFHSNLDIDSNMNLKEVCENFKKQGINKVEIYKEKFEFMMKPIGNKPKEEDSSKSYLKSHLQDLANITSEKQKDYFEWQKKNSKSITKSHISELSEEDQNRLAGEKFSVKMCYKNASEVCAIIPGAKYVEGYVSFMGIPIEHAWNKIGDKYIDVTKDQVLKGDEFKEYLSVIELSHMELLSHLEKTMVYGDLIKEVYKQEKK